MGDSCQVCQLGAATQAQGESVGCWRRLQLGCLPGSEHALPCQRVCFSAAVAQPACSPFFLLLQAARKAAWEARQAAAAEGEQQQSEDGEGSEGSEEEEEEEGDAADGGDREDACSLASDDDATAAHAAPAEGEGSQQQQGGEAQQQQQGAAAQQQEGEQQFVSTVSIITADFAMQNVIMQMGLRLMTPDGRRITKLSRWVLRCAACFLVTKVSPHFLPVLQVVLRCAVLRCQPTACCAAQLCKHLSVKTIQPSNCCSPLSAPPRPASPALPCPARTCV